MSAAALVAKCQALGVTLAISPDGKLRATPPGKLPDNLREELRQQKAEVLALLQGQESTAYPDYRGLYREMAEAVHEDCFLIDPVWLQNHPEFYARIRALDMLLGGMERQDASGEAYQRTLARMVALVQDARALQEQEQASVRAVQ